MTTKLNVTFIVMGLWDSCYVYLVTLLDLDPILTINYSCLACILLGCLAVYEYLGHMSYKRYINTLFCMTIFCIP